MKITRAVPSLVAVLLASLLAACVNTDGRKPLKQESSDVTASKYNIQLGNQMRTVTVTKVRVTDVEIDANHALVDKTLHFTVRVRQVREATKVELEHRHAHSPDHHH